MMDQLLEANAGTPESGFDVVATLASEFLGLDAVCVAEFTGPTLTIRSVAGRSDAYDLRVGRALRLVASDPEVVATLLRKSVVAPDARDDGRLATLFGEKAAFVGSYVSAPLLMSDGSLFGVLAGIGTRPDATLGERSRRFFQMLARLLSAVITEDRRRQHIRDDLSRLIAGEDLKIAYQPIVEIESGRCLGFEALARFPERFLNPPDKVFASAQEVGLGRELELLAVRLACEKMPPLTPGQFLAVNLSPSAVVALGDDLATRALIDRGDLVAEITEHEFTEHHEDVRDALLPHRQRGLRVAVDDAGTGYASLRRIVELEPDFIKIDISLVRGVATMDRHAMAVRTLSRLADDLGAIAIAEGVEDRADLEQLRWIGVPAAQGYYFARPTTNVSDLEPWIGPPPVGGDPSWAQRAFRRRGESPPRWIPSRRAERRGRLGPPLLVSPPATRRGSSRPRLFGTVLSPFEADDLPLLDAAVQRVTESRVRDLALL